jgi:NhaA family Na+:H+ antiporter
VTLSATFQRFVASEKAGGIALLACTVLAMALANSPLGPAYLGFWHVEIGGLPIERWVNDGLMAVFFLLVGLELERELYVGELSEWRVALLPIFAALGGIVVPASIHLALNAGTPAQAGAGIPMATDIAFALGVLALLGSRVPASLKVFLVALAVIDDLCAVVVIAVFYTSGLSFTYLAAAVALLAALVVLNRLRVMALWPYLLGGSILWALMLKSGVHATVAGVALAFAIPFTAKTDDEASPSHRLENRLHLPVALFVLPVFALANTGIVLDGSWMKHLTSANGLGIVGGLVIGKPLGIVIATALAVGVGVCALPGEVRWPHVAGAGLLGGIGYTMSIFITNLAFAGDPALVAGSKLAILTASLVAGVAGYLWLRMVR